MILDVWDSVAQARRIAAEPAAGARPTRDVTLEDAREDSAPSPTQPTEQKGVAAALQAIMKFIPAEVIALYMMLVGVFGQAWWIFWVGTLSIPAFIGIGHLEKSRALEDPSQAPTTFQLVLMWLFATIAYIPWCATLPETPFLQFSPDATRYGVGAAIILSGLMPRIGRLCGLVR